MTDPGDREMWGGRHEQDDAAGSAIGYYRLHQVSEQEALRQIESARDRYEASAARALGVSREAFTRAFRASR